VQVVPPEAPPASPVTSVPYRVVLYRCRRCEATEVVGGGGGGRRPVSPASAEAALENAVLYDVGRNHSAVPPGLRERVLARDGHRCRAVGCGATRFLEVHHRVRRADGGANAPANLVTLCSRCHRFMHEHPEAGRRLLERGSRRVQEAVPG
jgi:5-methylcytosine-specific restriction endonuclease McrA